MLLLHVYVYKSEIFWQFNCFKLLQMFGYILTYHDWNKKHITCSVYEIKIQQQNSKLRDLDLLLLSIIAI